MAHLYAQPVWKFEGVTTIRPLNDSECPEEVVAIDIDPDGDGEESYVEIVLTKQDVEDIMNIAYNRKG